MQTNSNKSQQLWIDIQQKRKRPSLVKSDIDKLNIYTSVKDTKFRFMSCSENLSELAGKDSPLGCVFEICFR
jgi:hypothetical protein